MYHISQRPFRSSIKFKTIDYSNNNRQGKSLARRQVVSQNAIRKKSTSKAFSSQTISYNHVRPHRRSIMNNYGHGQEESLATISVQIFRPKNLISNTSEVIKMSIINFFTQNSIENKEKIVNILQKNHKFFRKIDPGITHLITMLGKMTLYEPGQLVFDDSLQEKNRSQDDMGFLLFGRLQLKNQKKYYSKKVKDHETLFQHKLICQKQKYRYFCQVLSQSCILWLPKKQFHMMKRKCLLNWALRQKFNEFQNLLNFYFVSKKLKKVKDNWSSVK